MKVQHLQRTKSGTGQMKGKVNTLNLIASNGNILQDGLELAGAKKENESVNVKA